MGFKIIFFSVWLILQFLGYNLGRALIWQLNLRRKWIHKLLYLFIFIILNGSMIATYLRLFREVFKYNAIMMVSLWFVFLATVMILILKKVLPKIHAKRYAQNADILPRDLRKIAPLILLSIYGLGLFNAYVPTTKYLTIQIDKPLAKPVRVGLAADLHLGVLVGKRQLNKLANLFNEEKVDVILLAGDIMDDNTVVYEAENMRPELEKIRAPLGVYATLGNHDLFGAQKQITQALEQAGVRVLTDEAVFLDKRFWVVGRPDSMDKNRLKTKDLLKKTNTQQPIFLIDHRPDGVLEHAKLPIDLQVSGHVHNGQIFPANILVRFLNEIHYGHGERNGTHFVVTSGFGFWGVPFRLGSQSEVWIIDVVGKL